MKLLDKMLVVAVGITAIALCATAQPSSSWTINGWGADNDSTGFTITDNGNGSFTASGSPISGDIRAALPSGPITIESSSAWGTIYNVVISGSFTVTSGSMSGNQFRIGLLNYPSLGTMSNGVWSVGSAASGYWYGPATASNPGEIVVQHDTENPWYTSTGAYDLGPIGVSAGQIDGSGGASYDFSISLTWRHNSEAMIGNYSLQGDNNPVYSASGSFWSFNSDYWCPTSFNAIAIYGNSSDTAFQSGITFSGLTETISQVPEPSSLTLIGMGALAGAFALQRRKS